MGDEFIHFVESDICDSFRLVNYFSNHMCFISLSLSIAGGRELAAAILSTHCWGSKSNSSQLYVPDADPVSI